MPRETSCARSTARERARPRQEIPIALVKQAIASPLTRARVPMHAIATARLTAELDWQTRLNKLWYKSHLLAKPFNGGNAQMAALPSKKQAAVTGIVFTSPPITPMSLVPVAES